MRYTKAPESLSSVLGNLLKKRGWERKIKEFQALANWPKIVGPKVAENSKPVRIEGKKLFVRVENSVWKNELIFMEKEIKNKLNQSVAGEVVKDIVFVN
ncbi:MAG: hypothetical protein A2145_00995 [candidate division Zixibacteria bacterium RBG_16_40_9]|nr:MAG: hypothetical protein A2145_00995 [candidate division Zixibacteria bacterium RBG_16_40_9]